MGVEEQLVDEAQEAAERVIGEGPIAPHELEARLTAIDPRLDGSIVGVAILRLLRSGRIELSEEFAFVPARVVCPA